MSTDDGPRPARTGADAPLPHLVATHDPVVCRLRTGILVCTAVAMLGSVGVLLGSPYPPAGWKWAMVALLAVPAIRTTTAWVLVGLVDLVLLYLVSWPGLGAWTSVAVLGLHTAATAWFLGSTVRPSAVLHASAVRTIGLRWLWVQAAAQLAVVLATATARLPSDVLIGSLGVLALLGLVVAIAVASTSGRPGPPGGSR